MIAMLLAPRPTGLASPAYADRADYSVIEDGRIIVRIYESPYSPADYRWFWSITAFHVDPRLEDNYKRPRAEPGGHVDPRLEITTTAARQRLRKPRRSSS